MFTGYRTLFREHEEALEMVVTVVQSVTIFNATKTVHSKMEKIINFQLHVLYHNKNIDLSMRTEI